MSEVESVKQEPQFAAFIGIDWADKKHVWRLQAVGSEKRESGELEHTPEAVEAWSVSCANDLPVVPSPWRWKQSRGALGFILSKYEPLPGFSAVPRPGETVIGSALQLAGACSSARPRSPCRSRRDDH